MDGFDRLVTESRGNTAADYDLLPSRELVGLINAGDSSVAAAVAAAADRVADAVDAIVERLDRGGRLIYAGAGSSGRLAAIDAYECQSTFSTPPGTVVALVAGDESASPLEQEAAEDDAEAGRRDVGRLAPTPDDAVVAVSASGRTPYAVGALEAAAAAGSLTVCVVSVPDSELARQAQHEIAVVVGPEFIAGSTRMKAGTAQKLVLNTISTVAMIRLGKTYGDLMVDVAATNAKLRARARRVVTLATGATADDADRALAAADGSAKVAIVSLLAGVGADEARARLNAAGGHLRRALP